MWLKQHICFCSVQLAETHYGSFQFTTVLYFTIVLLQTNFPNKTLTMHVFKSVHFTVNQPRIEINGA